MSFKCLVYLYYLIQLNTIIQLLKYIYYTNQIVDLNFYSIHCIFDFIWSMILVLSKFIPRTKHVVSLFCVLVLDLNALTYQFCMFWLCFEVNLGLKLGNLWSQGNRFKIGVLSGFLINGQISAKMEQKFPFKMK